MSNFIISCAFSLWLGCILVGIGRVFAEEKSLCVYLTCQGNALVSGQQEVRACKECRGQNLRRDFELFIFFQNLHPK